MSDAPKPGYDGVFEVRFPGALLWERKRAGGFPDAKEQKKRLRDVIEPGRDLAHLDRYGAG